MLERLLAFPAYNSSNAMTNNSMILIFEKAND